MVHFPGEDLFARSRSHGLPIGNLTSQFWANVYLNELDQFVERRLKDRAYLQYMDDFLLFSDNKAELRRRYPSILGTVCCPNKLNPRVEIDCSIHEKGCFDGWIMVAYICDHITAVGDLWRESN